LVTWPALKVARSMRRYGAKMDQLERQRQDRQAAGQTGETEFEKLAKTLEPVALSKILGFKRVDFVMLVVGFLLLLFASGWRAVRGEA
jgi:hypothetical protein